jgi:hypothetical protein
MLAHSRRLRDRPVPECGMQIPKKKKKKKCRCLKIMFNLLIGMDTNRPGCTSLVSLVRVHQSTEATTYYWDPIGYVMSMQPRPPV